MDSFTLEPSAASSQSVRGDTVSRTVFQTFLTYLQDTQLAQWVSGSPSLLGYPTILVLHTVGLALLVGGSVAVDLRLLGVARAAPVGAVGPLFRLMWIGLAINAATGVLLFIADAVGKAHQPIFWAKLACVAGGVWVMMRLGPMVDGAQPADGRGGRRLAVASLVLWTGAMVSGRLMAYLK